MAHSVVSRYCRAMAGLTSYRGPFVKALVLAVALGLAPDIASSQDSAATGSVRGTVVGPANMPLEDAIVDVLGLGRARTDSAGAFRFSGLRLGTFILQATKIGFRPSLKTIVIRTTDEMNVGFALERSVQELERVIVRSDSAVNLRSDPTGFELRRRGGLGTFITSEQIDARNAMETGQLFQAIAGVEIDRNGVVAIARGPISINAACGGAQVFVDGVAMHGAFSVNDIAIASIRGIELYRGPATTPMQLRSSKTVCGTVAIWTK